MKEMKLFPKTFLYTLGLMLVIVLIAHALFYFLTPRAVLGIELKTESSGLVYETSVNIVPYVTQAVLKVLPVSLVLCLLISAGFSFLFSRHITNPVRHICVMTGRMEQMDKNAACHIRSKDEIGVLADNINKLYQTLLTVIQNLETEKQHMNENEKSKADFMRMASHELKTPVTALNAMLENMILGIGKYKDYDAYLPDCKEMAERLSDMIHDILETSKVDLLAENEIPVETEISELLESLCAPYRMIAKARGIIFDLDLSESFTSVIQTRLFSKALSNILANAAAYTPAGRKIAVYFSGNSIIIENECVPVPPEIRRHLMEPFYRPDFARSRNEGGTGLGLYIVDTYFKAMNINYSFLPMEQPEGMRFTINL